MLDDLLSHAVPADTDDDAGQAPSPAVHPLDELALYGCRPFQDDADPRPLPEPHAAEGAVAGALNALADLFCGTRLEDDLPDLLWSFVNLFHRKADRITRDLDDNEQAQRRSQAEQDGSEVKSVDLERLIAQGLTLTERRNAFEFLRDHAAEHYAAHTGSAWRPRSGSMVNHRTLTAAMIDSRDFLNAKRRAETEVLLPPGPRIAFAGGVDYNDHARIWAALDQVREKHPAMVLMHGGSPKGAERIAACWADQAAGAPGRLQARLGPAQERGSVQAQRPDARSYADRGPPVSGLGHQREPGRQGPQDRHPGEALRAKGRRRLGAASRLRLSPVSRRGSLRIVAATRGRRAAPGGGRPERGRRERGCTSRR